MSRTTPSSPAPPPRCLLCGAAARGADELQGRPMKDFWLAHNRLAPVIRRRPHPGGAWLPALVTGLYRKLGCRHYLPHRGLSLYHVYRKP